MPIPTQKIALPGRLMHGEGDPSSWITRWSHLIKPGSEVLDVACGYGRHTRWLAARGYRLVAVDRAPDALDAIDLPAEVCEKHVHDLEAGPWPFAGRQFDAVVVTNYLWRPLLAPLLASLAPGGVLLYETFASGQESIGKPSRADFLLRPGELLEQCRGMRVVAYEDGFESAGPRFVQRIAAVLPPGMAALSGPLAGPAVPLRHELEAGPFAHSQASPGPRQDRP
jgi:SAM-dependent methyltransferase